MNKLSNTVICAALAICLTGCAGMTKQNVGVLAGGTAGALLGSRFGHGSGQVAATALGAVAGAVIGGAIGNSMDRTDQLQAQRALETARTNKPYRWRNPDSGTRYTVTPKKTSYQRDGQPCREYTTTAMIGGKQQQVYGKACRKADGSWKIIS